MLSHDLKVLWDSAVNSRDKWWKQIDIGNQIQISWDNIPLNANSNSLKINISFENPSKQCFNFKNFRMQHFKQY